MDYFMNTVRRIQGLMNIFPDKTLLTTGCGPTSAALLHVMASARISGLEAYFINPGYLESETLDHAKYLRSFFPITEISVPRDPTFEKQLDLAKSDPSALSAFCYSYKFEPTRKLFEEKKPVIWLSALRNNSRREHKVELRNDRLLGTYQVREFCPMFDWTDEQMTEYMTGNNLKYNHSHHDVCKGVKQNGECQMRGQEFSI